MQKHSRGFGHILILVVSGSAAVSACGPDLDSCAVKRTCGVLAGAHAGSSFAGTAGIGMGGNSGDSSSTITGGSPSAAGSGGHAQGAGSGFSTAGTDASIPTKDSGGGREDGGAAGAQGGISASGSSSADGPASLHVRGTVVDANLKPLPGAAVRIGAAYAKTDGSGHFEFDGILAPYDLLVADVPTNSALRYVVVYQGLTRVEPTIQVRDAWTPTTEGSAKLYGSLVGGSAQVDAPDTWHTTAFASNLAFTQDGASSGNTGNSNTFNVFPHWYDAAYVSGRLLGLQWQGARDAPISFTGFGWVPMDVHSGDSKEDLLLNLNEDVGTDHLSGSVVMPDGYAAPILQSYLTFDANTSMWLTTTTVAKEFQLATPKVEGGSIAVRMISGLSGVGSAWAAVTGLSADGDSGKIVIPAIPIAEDPLDSATGVTVDARFAWADAGLPVYEAAVMFKDPSVSSPLPIYRILTTAREISLPKVDDLGIDWPTDATGEWSVRAMGPFKSVDDAASRSGYMSNVFRAESSYPQPPSVSMATATTEDYPSSFTTAP